MHHLVGLRPLVIPVLLAMGLVTAMTAPVTHGAEPSCRIRNVSQGTTGHRLQRMVDEARAGDRLTVRGTCRSVHVDVERDLTIRGVGHRPTLTGLDTYGSPVLSVRRGAHVVLRDLTIERGAGGAISNGGRLKLMGSVVQDSSSEVGGGGISNGRRLIVVDSIIRRNRAVVEDPRALARGGGIMSTNQSSRLTLRRSTVAGNSVEGRGGGIYSSSQTPVRLVDSIVRGNRAYDYEYGSVPYVHYGEGGGVFVQGPLTLVDSIVRRNRADARGGGIFNSDLIPRFRDDAKLIGSSVTDNTAGIEGGGIWNGGTVTLDDASSVTDNTPDDCVGTSAC